MDPPLPDPSGQDPPLPRRRSPAAPLRPALVKIAALPADHVRVTPDGPIIVLADNPLPLPEPFAELVLEHVTHRPNLRTNNHTSPWLFPSRAGGRHLHPVTIMNGLRSFGIDLQAARTSALRGLLSQAPPPRGRAAARLQLPGHRTPRSRSGHHLQPRRRGRRECPCQPGLTASASRGRLAGQASWRCLSLPSSRATAGLHGRRSRVRPRTPASAGSGRRTVPCPGT